MTVFCALTLPLVLSLIFALTEAARYQGLQLAVEMDARLEAQSLLAGYCSPLWEEYELLFLDGAGKTKVFSNGHLQDRLLEECQMNTGEKEKSNRLDLYAMHVKKAEIGNYQLASDEKGAALRQQAAARMREQIPLVLLQKLKEQSEHAKGADDRLEKKIREGASTIEKSKKEQIEEPKEGVIVEGPKHASLNGTSQQGENGENEVSTDPTQGLIPVVDNLDILNILVDNPQKISKQSISNANRVWKRKKEHGNWKEKAGHKGEEDLLFQLYLKEHCTNYRKVRKGHDIQYELEYLIAGKDTDRKNLSSVVRRILLIRECSNLIYYETNAKKQKEAKILALAIAGVLGNPELVQVIQQLILAGWAYEDSLSDMRQLLAGKEVPCIKGKTELGKCGYERYLQILMLFTDQSKLTYRAMDLMEHQVQKEPGYENFRMDHMIYKSEIEIVYEAPVVFGIFLPIKQDPWTFTEQKIASYSN